MVRRLGAGKTVGVNLEQHTRIAAGTGFFAALEPYSKGVYVNFTNDDSAERLRTGAYSPEQWTRLVGLKAKYDPANFFRQNANIPPNGA